MLRFIQPSTSSSSSSSPGNNMDLSVLERQRAILQHLYDQQQSHTWQHQENDQQQQSHFWHPLNPDHQMATTSNNSSITGVKLTKADPQCNSSFPNKEANFSCSIKKRKAEFYIEEEECNDKGLEAEEQSEISTKIDRENSINTCSKESSKAFDVQKPDYIHVRARRGQATDSHSLAERARREKISKKMKYLQDLVPGCNKVTGKAGMLDEIINYVQSLQKQVEFLSMKLGTLNPRLDFNIDNFFTKEVQAYIGNLPAAATQFGATNSTCFQHSTKDQSQILPQKTANFSVPSIQEQFLDSSYISKLQQLSGWEFDLPSLFNAGFH